eukprot:scpid63606/ scgid14777/ Alpha-(1,3)-fucosyltransferase 11; Fucosyltransferase XI; Galactoside 3-L-fucosyltransferase 11
MSALKRSRFVPFRTDRRGFLRLAIAALALIGIAAPLCLHVWSTSPYGRDIQQKVEHYVRQENIWITPRNEQRHALTKASSTQSSTTPYGPSTAAKLHDEMAGTRAGQSQRIGTPVRHTGEESHRTGIVDTSSQTAKPTTPYLPVTNLATQQAPERTGTSLSKAENCSTRWLGKQYRTEALWKPAIHWSHPQQVFHFSSGRDVLFPSSCVSTSSLEDEFRSCRRKFVLVLRWSRIGGTDTFAGSKHDLLPFECCVDSGVTWLMTGNRSRLADADIVEFYLLNLPARLPERGKPEQIFLLFFMESPVWKHSKVVHVLKHAVNIARSYHFSAHLYTSYPPVPGEWAARAKFTLSLMPNRSLVPFAERVPKAVASLVSNCNAYNNRTGVLRSLSRLVEMHNYGKCFHNRNLPKEDNQWNNVPYSLSKYKLAFSLESALCTDYISEKSLRYLMLGVVPIVSTWRGRPDYAKRMPNNHSYVDLSDFDSVQDVGRYL